MNKQPYGSVVGCMRIRVFWVFIFHTIGKMTEGSGIADTMIVFHYYYDISFHALAPQISCYKTQIQCHSQCNTKKSLF